MSSRKRERVLTHTGTSRSNLTGMVTLTLTDEKEPDRPYVLLMSTEQVEDLARWIERVKIVENNRLLQRVRADQAAVRLAEAEL